MRVPVQEPKQQQQSRTNEHPKPAYSEPGSWTPEKREAWAAYALWCIRAGIDPRSGQPDRLPPETREPRAAAYLARLVAEDLTLERARLSSGETPPGYRGYWPKWAEGGPPHPADPTPIPDPGPELCADCPEENTG